MANEIKAAFVGELKRRYGTLRKLEGSYSLLEIGKDLARVYVRYSKVHGAHRTFYGLRQEDLRQLAGHLSFICFLWDGQDEPVLVPFSDYEDVFRSTSPASDGQYKAQVFLNEDGIELYIAQAGRFSAEGYVGWAAFEMLVDTSRIETAPDLSHTQVQTLLGAIGSTKGYDIWIPPNDRPKLDWSIADCFECRRVVPSAPKGVIDTLQEVDVIWLGRGSNDPQSLFEVEHSTPVYSGLLRFNDIHLVMSHLRPRFSVVAKDGRRDLFIRQISRATFKMSGLSELCTFLDYLNVFGWYGRCRTK